MFRKCSCCGREWADRDEFLSDPQVKLVGYQVEWEKLEAGYFLFNHTPPGCGSTLSLAVASFVDLYSGPLFTKRLTTAPECGGFCLHRDSLDSCPADCECAYVRVIIQIVKDWQKRAA